MVSADSKMEKKKKLNQLFEWIYVYNLLAIIFDSSWNIY